MGNLYSTDDIFEDGRGRGWAGTLGYPPEFAEWRAKQRKAWFAGREKGKEQRASADPNPFGKTLPTNPHLGG